MAITVTGAAVRLTSSGLGCTDWPTCSVNTELDEPGFHSAVEFGNRVISGLAIVPVVAAWFASRRVRRDLLKWIWLLTAGFVGQVVLGMAVTRTELDPRVVLGHFLLSIALIFLAALLDHRARRGPGDATAAGASERAAPFSGVHGWLLVGLTTAVIVVGTLVTGSGPHTGSDESGDAIPRLGFAIRDITRVHSVLVWILAAALVWNLWQLRDSDSTARRWLMGITVGAVVQGAIGYAQYFTGVPVFLVGLHVAGAVGLWTAVVIHALRSSTVVDRLDHELVAAT